MSQTISPPYYMYPPEYSVYQVPNSHSKRDKWRQPHALYQTPPPHALYQAPPTHALYPTSPDIGYTRPQQAIYPSNRLINPGFLYGNQPLPGQATSHNQRNRNAPISRRTTIEKEDNGRTDNTDTCLMAVIAAICCCFLCSDLGD